MSDCWNGKYSFAMSGGDAMRADAALCSAAEANDVPTIEALLCIYVEAHTSTGLRSVLVNMLRAARSAHNGPMIQYLTSRLCGEDRPASAGSLFDVPVLRPAAAVAAVSTAAAVTFEDFIEPVCGGLDAFIERVVPHQPTSKMKN